ncbi:MAG TPA: RsmB/NOP family class I SAM-dependent RNA methyltransferase [Chlamydiales bacterium]|nr:RsmB/NOP family class I SAM-dependent RNA methyltransferase [Chlamydiales bacterium]
MKTPFCEYHIASFFSDEVHSGLPLDLALSNYFKNHKSLGARDRKIIGDAAFGMVRWKTLLDHLCRKSDILGRIRCFNTLDWSLILQNPSIPEPARLGVPAWLLERFNRDFGMKEAQNICRILNTQAPLTIRANLLKTNREHLLSLWASLGAFPCKSASQGIFFSKRIPLFSFPEFKLGLFEVQDEGSQIVASQLAVKPGEAVLDFCSGSGGKALAIVPQMQGKGQIYLHDIRPRVLLEAGKRLKRAGVQNAQFLHPSHKTLARLKNKCDWVLIDVPCSGTGTLRRNPDQKWKLNPAAIERLKEEQRAIAKEAVGYVKPGGRLVYATCSILQEENEDQVKIFLNDLPLNLERPPLFLAPLEGGMDGFFVAVFKKMNSMLQ